MTWEELNGVRNLNQTVCGIEKRLRALRVAAENIVPILDGLPHAAIAHSQVEKIALKIVESERELEQNLRILTERKAELADRSDMSSVARLKRSPTECNMLCDMYSNSTNKF